MDSSPLTLPDLLELELQLLQDEDADETELRRRDRAIGKRLAGALPPSRLLLGWLREVRETGTVAQTFTVVRFVLAAAGLLVGGGATAGLLSGGGGQPVNVFHFLTWMVGLQILLLALLVLVLLPIRWTSWIPGLRGSHLLVTMMLKKLGNWAGGEKTLALRSAVGMLRARHAKFADAERWTITGLVQVFGVAFNVGAVGVALLLVTFTDLAFSWSTTLQWSGEFFHSLVRTVALPWAWAVPDADVTLDLVAQTRYSRLEGGYVRPGGDSTVAGGWWPFLVMAVTVYGFLPRVGALVFASWRCRAALARVAIDADGRTSRVIERLTHEFLSSEGDAQDPPPESAVPAVPKAPLPEGAKTCDLIVWDGVTMEGDLVRSRFGWTVARRFAPGQIPDGDASSPVVLVPPPWEDPTKATLRVIRSLRGAVGASRSLVVFLIQPGRREIWERVLDTLGDPALRVEAAS